MSEQFAGFDIGNNELSSAFNCKRSKLIYRCCLTFSLVQKWIQLMISNLGGIGACIKNYLNWSVPLRNPESSRRSCSQFWPVPKRMTNLAETCLIRYHSANLCQVPFGNERLLLSKFVLLVLKLLPSIRCFKRTNAKRHFYWGSLSYTELVLKLLPIHTSLLPINRTATVVH